MDNLSSLLDVRRIEFSVHGSEKFSGAEKELGGRIDETALWWLGHFERMVNSRIFKRTSIWVVM